MSSVFNPVKWREDALEEGQISSEVLTLLDNRYINLGESVIDQNINNLYVTNLRITNAGMLHFAHDNTTQTTAFNPNFVTNQINQFTSNNNTFSGEQKFLNFKVIDASGNETKIFQTGNNVFLENTEANGNIFFYTYTNGGLNRSISSIDQFGNITSPNDLVGNRLRANSVLINGVFNILRDANYFTFQNNVNGSGYFFKTKQSNGTNGWQLTFESNGSLYGMSNVITHSSESKSYKFRDQTSFNLTSSQIFLSPANDLIFENRVASQNTRMRFLNYQSNGIQSEVILDQFANVSGINDLNIRSRLSFANNSITHQYINAQYVIDNKNNGSSIKMRNYDAGGVMREMIIDPLLNMSGLNNVSCSSLSIGGQVKNFNNYDLVVDKTSIMTYTSFPHQQVNYATSLGQISLVPYISVNGAYNNITKEKDAVIYFNNNVSSALSIVPWVSTPSGALRITENNSELYKPKVMDTLEFSDGSQQETAMTDDYLNAKIQAVVSQMGILGSVPSGTILAYGGNIENPAPTGFVYCIGSQMAIASAPNLFNVIGHNFSNGKVITSGFFWLPDLSGAYLKGCGIGLHWIDGRTTPINSVGGIQQANVGHHQHQYIDRGIGSKAVAARMGPTADSTDTARPTWETYYTGSETYNRTSQALNDIENRPNSIGVNYIIKL